MYYKERLLYRLGSEIGSSSEEKEKKASLVQSSGRRSGWKERLAGVVKVEAEMEINSNHTRLLRNHRMDLFSHLLKADLRLFSDPLRKAVKH